MAESKKALVLHLIGSSEPLVFALSESAADDLGGRLGTLLHSGDVESPELADGSTVAINFARVATAHLDELPPLSKVYGSVHSRGGFAN